MPTKPLSFMRRNSLVTPSARYEPGTTAPVSARIVAEPSVALALMRKLAFVSVSVKLMIGAVPEIEREPASVSASVVLLYVKPESPPNAPLSLNCTWVLVPPTTPTQIPFVAKHPPERLKPIFAVEVAEPFIVRPARVVVPNPSPATERNRSAFEVEAISKRGWLVVVVACTAKDANGVEVPTPAR